MAELNTYNLRNILKRSSFYSNKTFQISELASDTILQISRVPHRYGLAYTAIGSAPHLLDFEGVEGFDGLMRADGFDLMRSSVAMKRTLFELLERVWCFSSPGSDVVRASRADLGDPAISPEDFILLSPFEYESLDGFFVEYSSALELDWVTCFSLVSTTEARTRLVPSALVYQGYGHRHPSQRFVPTLSTGLAAATRYDDAILRAICEILERDAFMVRWLGRIKPPVVENARDFFSDEISEVMEMLEEDGFKVTFYNLTLEIPVPVILMAIEGKGADETPLSVLGLGCDPCARSALAKAVREGLEMMSNFFDFPGGHDIEHNGKIPKGSPEQKKELTDFLKGTRDRSNMASLETTEKDSQTMPAKLISLLKRIEKAGFSAFYCDLTPADDAFPQDFVLVRAMMPHLQPMLYETNCWRLGNPRLFRLVKELSHNKGAVTESDLNLQINPFAAESIL